VIAYGLAGKKSLKNTEQKLEATALFRSLPIPAPHGAAAWRKSIWPDRQSYQNVSRETVLSDPGPESVNDFGIRAWLWTSF
jgi:hypothetical protein